MSLGTQLFKLAMIQGRSHKTEIDSLVVTKDLVDTGVTVLPTENILQGHVYKLNVTDTVAKAPPGLYRMGDSGWVCLGYSSHYDLGDISGVVELNLIAGCIYVVNVIGEVLELVINTSCGTTMIRFANPDGYACIPPTGCELGSWVVADVVNSLVVITACDTIKLANSGELV